MAIILEKGKIEDADMIREAQRICFLPLLEKYHDDDFNPCNESLESIQNSIINHYFYKIFYDRTFAGGIYVHENPDPKHFKLHTLFILPELQGRGVGQKAIEEVEKIHSQAIEWVLETPHDLKRNHHVYEKYGYKRTGVEEKINDKLTLIHYKKEVI